MVRCYDDANHLPTCLLVWLVQCATSSLVLSSAIVPVVLPLHLFVCMSYLHAKYYEVVTSALYMHARMWPIVERMLCQQLSAMQRQC